MIKHTLTVLCVLSAALFSYQSLALTDKQRGVFPLDYEQPRLPKGATAAYKPFKLTDVACQYTFAPIVDARINKEAVGATFNKPLRAQGIEQWLTHYNSQALTPMAATASEGKGDFAVKSELVRLYSYFQGMSIRGVMAIKLEIGEGEQAQTHFVRGYSSRTNWNNALTEYGDAINKASHDLAVNLGDILKTHCDSVASL